MDPILAILAGAVQGLTEFLPISSTAHLIIFQDLLGLSQDKYGLTFDASIHLGTLIAVLTFFAKDYIALLRNNLYFKLFLGTIPAAVAGYLFENLIENEFRSLFVVGLALILFSAIIYSAEKFGKKNRDMSKITSLDSLAIGVAQALALIPGVSRSGATISAGLFLGQTRESAARFAFVLSGPVIAGAGLKKLLEAITAKNESSDVGLIIIGIASSFVFGYLTIKYFLRFVSTHNLYPFIIYRVVLGFILVFFSLLQL